MRIGVIIFLLLALLIASCGNHVCSEREKPRSHPVPMPHAMV